MSKNNFNMKKFEKMLNDTKEQMVNDALKADYDYECPNCNKTFKISIGKNICPQCETVVDLKPDDSWKKF